jgi:tRNA(adenine34) deaminase
VTDDTHYMSLALAQAELAASVGEVPVGAVVVRHGQVIAAAHNTPITDHDPSAHAEIQALRMAAAHLGNYRLDGCELFVTLEPCAMCAGAMLHARLNRVVYGASDPKTGAAGSVLNLFAIDQLNHQTQVQGGILAQESSLQLQNFFKDKRQQERASTQVVREDALRTPDACFDGLPGFPWTPHFVSDLPALAGLRMHYLDEGERDSPLTWLCLHGNPAWSYLYRKMIPEFLGAGDRVVAPDLIGFGKSDKLKKDSAHSFTWHRQCLLELIERLDLRNTVLVIQDWGGILGLTLPMAAPDRFQGALIMNTTLATGDQPLSPGFLAWREMCASKPEFSISRLFARGNPQMTEAECAAYDAPFPDKGHRAATRAFPAMVPEHADDDGAATSRQAREFWHNTWNKPTLMAVGAQDPVLGTAQMAGLRHLMHDRPELLVIEQGGHFVQEHGQLIAQAAVQFFTKPPPNSAT